ncbi:hypothetical protein CKAH01_05554 [Colletotrichum kahawae]|uniref:Uncharacterized protein n=1 Tax=Colletotrichum kahawae TaxID=34407 RepID=A0AAD9YEF1_COLKA|nr:hypothetical protein CKAH01_05554 [Colletotrichum kahawae]
MDVGVHVTESSSPPADNVTRGGSAVCPPLTGQDTDRLQNRMQEVEASAEYLLVLPPATVGDNALGGIHFDKGLMILALDKINWANPDVSLTTKNCDLALKDPKLDVMNGKFKYDDGTHLGPANACPIWQLPDNIIHIPEVEQDTEEDAAVHNGLLAVTCGSRELY